VKAKVLKIKWTGTGLKAGDLITVVYRLEKDRENGDERIGTGACYRPPPTMKAGERWNLALDQSKERDLPSGYPQHGRHV
jgi:hypothetical protein